MNTKDIKEYTFNDWNGSAVRVLYAWDSSQAGADIKPLSDPICMYIEGYANGKWMLVEGTHHVTREHVAIERDNSTRMTNLQLAYWMSLGNRQVFDDPFIASRYAYSNADDNSPVRKGVKVREILCDAQGIRATDWVEPTVDLLKPVQVDLGD